MCWQFLCITKSTGTQSVQLWDSSFHHMPSIYAFFQSLYIRQAPAWATRSPLNINTSFQHYRLHLQVLSHATPMHWQELSFLQINCYLSFLAPLRLLPLIFLPSSCHTTFLWLKIYLLLGSLNTTVCIYNSEEKNKQTNTNRKPFLGHH